MIDIEIFQDAGTITAGRGTPIAVDNFNMKSAAAYSTAYYPTNETSSAPLVRPVDAGAQTLSFKVFTFFKLTGTYSWIKNLRFRVTTATASEASNAQLFFKNTNVYETPTNNFDGNMLLLADKNGVVYSDPIYPMLSLVGPNSATTRATAYTNVGGVSILYTNYFVTQIRVNTGSLVGNTAEMQLKFEAYEYYEV